MKTEIEIISIIGPKMKTRNVLSEHILLFGDHGQYFDRFPYTYDMTGPFGGKRWPGRVDLHHEPRGKAIFYLKLIIAVIHFLIGIRRCVYLNMTALWYDLRGTLQQTFHCTPNELPIYVQLRYNRILMTVTPGKQ